MMATAATAPDVMPMMTFTFIGGVLSACKETVVMVVLMPVLVGVLGGGMLVKGTLPVVTVSKLGVQKRWDLADELSARLEGEVLMTVVVVLNSDIPRGRLGCIGDISMSVRRGEVSALEGACAGNASGFGRVSSENSIESIGVSVIHDDSTQHIIIISLPTRVLVVMLVTCSEGSWPSIILIIVEVIVVKTTKDCVQVSVQTSVVMENGTGGRLER